MSNWAAPWTGADETKVNGFSGNISIISGTGVSIDSLDNNITISFSGLGGTVTSVGATGASGIGITGSPITSSGTFAFSLENITPTSVSTGNGTFSGLISTNVGTAPTGANHFAMDTTGGVRRFGIGLNGNETGSNAGSDFYIFGYNDAGNFLSDALRLRRSDGAITVGNWQATPINLSSFASGTLQAAQFPALTGDITTPGASLATTLATVNSNVGSFGSATQVGAFTVNAKGLITAASNIIITGTTPGGSAGGDLTGTYPNPTIAANGVTDAKLRQGVATSVIGRSANSTGNVADIAATVNQSVLRRDNSGILGFGALTLSSPAAVTGFLPVANGGTGTGFIPSSNSLAYYANAGAYDYISAVVVGSVLLSTTTGASPGIPAWGQLDLGSSVVTGTASTAHGGTGNTGFSAGSIIFADGTKLTEAPSNLTYSSSTTSLQVVGTIKTAGTTNGEIFNIITNSNTGTAAFSALRLANSSGNNLIIRLNSTGFSGAANAATIQNAAGILQLFGSGGNGLTVTTGSNVGVNCTPVNKLDIAGATVVGGSYAGVNTAPTNGMLVEGQTIFGATSSFINARVEVQGSDRISFGMGGTKTATDGVSQAIFYVGPTFAPTSTTSVCTNFLMYPQFNPPTGVNIANAYGMYLQTGGQGGLGTITNGYGLYVDHPNYGTTSAMAAFLGDLSIGYAAITPPSGGAIISGAISIGASTNTYKLDVTGGDIGVMSDGNTLRIKDGLCKGSATMVLGTVTVTTSAVATSTFVNVSRTATGGTLGVGMPTITIVNGTSFTLTSSSALETSTYRWWLTKAS